MFTVAHLEYLRDHAFPLTLEMLHERESFLLGYGKIGAEQFRQSKGELFGYQNSRKARMGGLKGLKDQAVMDRKVAAEKALRDSIAGKPEYAGAWEKIAASKKVAAELSMPYSFLERGFAFDSELFGVARTLVRLAEEKAKPNTDRLREYRDSALESLDLALFSEAPIYPDFEKAKLARSLAFWQRKMGTDPMVERVLRGRTPEQAAADLISGSHLADVEVRKKIAEGGIGAITSADDPMIKLVLAIDADARALRKRIEDEVEGVDTAQYALIAKARFASLGDSTYPDATFTLRLAFGPVKGLERDGKSIPAYTNFAGAFAHAKAHGDAPPYQLPPSYFAARDSGKLKLDTPFNFITTADIIGGNSGSPVTNRANEVVGLIFDGNIDSLVLDFAYDDRLARAVSVDSRAILEALRSIYAADGLVSELSEK